MLEADVRDETWLPEVRLVEVGSEETDMDRGDCVIEALDAVRRLRTMCDIAFEQARGLPRLALQEQGCSEETWRRCSKVLDEFVSSVRQRVVYTASRACEPHGWTDQPDQRSQTRIAIESPFIRKDAMAQAFRLSPGSLHRSCSCRRCWSRNRRNSEVHREDFKAVDM